MHRNFAVVYVVTYGVMAELTVAQVHNIKLVLLLLLLYDIE